jgi:hypothetical protein
MPQQVTVNSMYLRQGVRAVSATLSLILSACGGGGGEGNRGSSTAPSFTLESHAVTHDATIADLSVQKRVPITFTGVAAGAPVIATVTYEGQAVAHADVASPITTSSNSALRVSLPPAVALVPGTYSGAVTISMCLASPCATPLAGSGTRVTVTYNVTRPTGSLAVRVSGPAVVPMDRLSFFASTEVPAPPIDVTFENLNTAPHLEVTHSSNIRTAFINGAATASNARIAAFLPGTNVLSPGIYSESITVKACTESACVNELDGSPFTTVIDHRLTDTLRLSGDNVLKVVPLPSVDFAWNDTLGKFIVAQASTSTAGAGKLVTYDPASGAVSDVASTGVVPFPIQQTDDGQYLYVGDRWGNAIRRFDLPTFALSQTITLGDSAAGEPLYARDLKSAPNAPRLIAVAMGDRGSTRLGNMLKIFDDGSARPSIVAPVDQTVLDPLIESICWTGNQQLIGARFEVGPTGGSLFEMGIDSTGATLTETIPNTIAVRSFERSRLHCAGGLVYSDTGRVFDPGNNSVMTLSIPGTAASGLLVNETQEKLFVLPGDNGSEYSFRVFNASTLQQVGELAAMMSPGSGGRRRYGRWGADGIAFSMGAADSGNVPVSIGSQYLVLVRGSFFAQ